MELTLEPGRTERHYWRDLWRYRELFLILAWRDLAVRYKQTAIGVVWAVLRPLLMTVTMTIVFGRIAKLNSDGGVPYSLLVAIGTLPWQFVATALSESSNSLVSNANLVSKVYFPRLIVPTASIMTSLVDFLITLVIVAALFGYYRFLPDWRLLFLPIFILLAFGVSFGAGIWLCALTVKYRDFRFVIPFMVQFGFYISPVGFSSTIVPEKWKLLFALNPMVGIIDGFRWALLAGKTTLWWPALLISLFAIVAFCATGIVYFRRTEKSFADVL